MLIPRLMDGQLKVLLIHMSMSCVPHGGIFEFYYDFLDEGRGDKRDEPSQSLIAEFCVQASLLIRYLPSKPLASTIQPARQDQIKANLSRTQPYLGNSILAGRLRAHATSRSVCVMVNDYDLSGISGSIPRDWYEQDSRAQISPDYIQISQAVCQPNLR